MTTRHAKLYRIALKADYRIDGFRWNHPAILTPYQKSCKERRLVLNDELHRVNMAIL